MGQYFSYVFNYTELFANEAQEVVPGLFISHIGVARSEEALKELKITHVVNVCEKDYPRVAGISYLHLPVLDDPGQDILPAAWQATAFIHKALAGDGNRVLVHCVWGRSRSAAVVIAYLMTHRAMTYDDALALLVEKRPVVQPNEGFANQLRPMKPK